MTREGMWTRSRIIEEAIDVLGEYDEQMTIRQLYYQLVTRGLPNGQKSYKQVVGAMEQARWDGRVDFDAFLDREREMAMDTNAEVTDLGNAIEEAKIQIEEWMTGYEKNTWENQPEYIEVWVEKKALQGVFEGPCEEKDVGLFACKGYPSLTALNEAAGRFGSVPDDKDKAILYFGDHDPSGDDIPRSIEETLGRMGADVNIERVALTREQVEEYHLPPAPVKQTDSRTANWDGIGQVELDALNPRKLRELITDAIRAHFDNDLYNDLLVQQRDERKKYVKALQKHVNGLGD